MRPVALVSLLALAMLLVAACSAQPTATPTPTPPPNGVPIEGGWLIPPELTTAASEVRAGEEVAFSGNGGYVLRNDGSYDESARTFPLTFAGVEAGSVSCYVNHCEGSITVPEGTAPGAYEVATEYGPVVSLTVVQ